MAKENIGLIIVDYIQLMYTGRSESRAQEVSRIARDLKVHRHGARGAGDRGFAAPQAAAYRHQEGAEPRGPQGVRAASSRTPTSSSCIYRPEVDDPRNLDIKGVAEVNLAKHRNGRTGKFKLYWMASYSKFENPQKRTSWPDERERAERGRRQPVRSWASTSAPSRRTS